MKDLLKKIKKNIDEYKLIVPEDRVVVGLSGGVDSVALLLALKEFCGEEKALSAIYVNHHLREAAKSEVEFCKSLCQDLGLDYYVKDVYVKQEQRECGGSEEEVARILRYKAFDELMEEIGGTKIAVAHHMEDQAETVIMRFIRGAGSLGLSGMEPMRGRVIRPLLGIHKEELEVFVKEMGYSHIVDESNLVTDYTRNKIRHELMPELKGYNEQIVDNLYRVSQIMSLENDYMETESESVFKKVVSMADGVLVLEVNGFMDCHQAIKNRVLRRCVKEIKGDVKNLSHLHLTRIYDLIGSQSGKCVPLVENITVTKEYGQLIFRQDVDRGINDDKSEKNSPNLVLSLDSLPITGYIQNANHTIYDIKVIDLKDNALTKYKDSFKNQENVYTKWFDYDKIKANLVFRSRISGDRITIDDKGHSKSVKKYFIDAKVPGSKRDNVLLMCSGNDVVWIAGYRVSADYYVTEETTKVLEVKLIKEDKDGKH